LVSGTSRWVSDAEGRPVRLATLRREDAMDYQRLSRQRDNRVRLRTLTLILLLTLSLFAVAFLLVVGPRWVWYAVAAAFTGVLGVIGSSAAHGRRGRRRPVRAIRVPHQGGDPFGLAVVVE
jgi:S-DNA-T family DNA segregation ATPase FtsK/SpoIIIE